MDADADVNGLINYVIQHQQEGARTGRAGNTGRVGRPNNLTSIGDADVPFSIHPRSGHLIVTDTPLIMKSYTLIIEASDQPSNPSEGRHSLAVVQVITKRCKSDLLDWAVGLQQKKKLEHVLIQNVNQTCRQISVLSPTLIVPKFVNIPYEFWIGSSAPVDTSVGQVRAEGFLEQEDIRYTMKNQIRRPGRVEFSVSNKICFVFFFLWWPVFLTLSIF